MGVRTCARRNCDNVMCDTHIPNIGYVCSNCQYEFKKFVKKRGLSVSDSDDIATALRAFIMTPKNCFFKDGISIDDFFRDHTNEM